MLTRRIFTLGAAAIAASGPVRARNDGAFEITRSGADWRDRLSPAQYAVLREHATERPYTNTLKGERSPLLENDRAGTYNCAGCGQGVYRSETKYDSATGWPSYWAAIEGMVGTQEDRSLFMVRTEVHCARCGGHLGHVFDDGPEPTGKRHCINGLAMTFTPDATGAVEGHPMPA